jgi:hypothetical protein
LSNTEAKVTVARCTLSVREDILLVAGAFVERIAIFQIQSASRLVGCRGWQLCGDAHRVDGLLQGIDLVQVFSLRRFFRRSVAFVGSIYCLRVALNNHWLKRWNLLLILCLANIGRWRSDACNLTHLRVVITLRLLRRVICSFNLLLHFHTILDGLRALLVRQIVVLDKLILVRALALFVGQSVVDLVLQNHLLERMSIDALAFIVAEYHLLWLALQCGDVSVLLVIVSLAIVALLLGPELLNAATVDLEFVVAEAALVLRRVLVVRYS